MPMAFKPLALLAMALPILLPVTAGAAEVNIYSQRQEGLIMPLLERFTEKTGIETRVVFSKSGVLERLKAEGDASPADIVLTTDIARIFALDDAGLLQPVQSDVIEANIPEKMRHPEGHWISLTKRARILAYAEDRVKPEDVQSYDDLAREDLGYGVCARSSSNVYMQSLGAFMVATRGEDGAREWVQGLVNNFARKPQGNDRDQVRGIYSGECDVAVLNTYYVGKMLANDDQKAWMEGTGLIFPDAGAGGTHINVSGGAMTKSAKNVEEAKALLEFLTSVEAQEIYAAANFEYPVNPAVKPSAIVAGFGGLVESDLPMKALADNNLAARLIYNEIGYD